MSLDVCRTEDVTSPATLNNEAISSPENSPHLVDIDWLVSTTGLSKTWWYARTRERGPNAVPKLKCGRLLRFEWGAVKEWLHKQYQA